ncbi:MAG: polysaccharide biosynthesis tyrosine autokinase [Nakamurella sp.]
MHGLEYFAILRKRWLYLLAPILIGLAAAAGLSYSATPQYQATASVYFSLPYGNTASDLYQGSNYTQQQLSSYANLATMPIVLNPVIAKLGLGGNYGQLAGTVAALASTDTVIIDIRVTNPSSPRAASIANAVADQLGIVVRQLSPKDAAGKSQIDVNTVATATPPAVPSTPKKKRNLVLGGLAGLFAGLLLALARDRFDTRVRTVKDVQGAPGLASIAFDKAAKKSPLIVGANVRSVRAESYRQLRTNLQFVHVDDPVKVVVVTSSVASEGKSSTAANLAAMFAEAGRRVLLVEADLRRPRVSDYLGLERSIGLTNVLAGQVDVDDVLQTWGSGGLTVLPSGSIPPNPSELLGSQNMVDLLVSLRAKFDMIIVDTPPLLPVTDAAVVAVQTDGAVVVVRYGKTTRSQIASALQSLQSVDARVLGVVLNMVPAKGADAVGSYDGYGYYEDDPTSGPLLELGEHTKSRQGKSRRPGSERFVDTDAASASDETDRLKESELPGRRRHGIAEDAETMASHDDATGEPSDEDEHRSGATNLVDSDSVASPAMAQSSDAARELDESSSAAEEGRDDETSADSLSEPSTGNGAVSDGLSNDESNADRDAAAAAVGDRSTFSADHNGIVTNKAQPTSETDRGSQIDDGRDQSGPDSGGADRGWVPMPVQTMNERLSKTAATADSDDSRTRRRRRRR